ncbi:unnamed protein product [Lactuca virosa]|uniref:TIR domain-containing protein n=1 Tax=Lactuca virosa TaxID=75947 RepID=A0AAU9P2T9_9ASTR|nr:unnamed protein product [Lactuca virosa]
MASSSTSSVPKRFKYDVFLSFSGEDTRKNFIDHLYHALQQNNIYTYKDDERIKKGKRISDELMGSIEASKYFIIVFSKNYASSSWCLDELVKIMDCHKTTKHTAYPVFYDVEPSEVRKQSGEVGEAFARHEKEEAAGKWREALKGAADLAGWELKNTADGHEAKFIRQIIEKLSLELRSIKVCIGKNLVGMETRINDIISSSGMASDGVSMIGIIGIGGGGKTTLAKTIFNKISFQFEGKSFIENVREVSNASLSGMELLQNKVLSNVLNDKGIHVGSECEGKNMMSWMMRGRKVLLVLDDVDHIDQLEALAGDPNWFKPGSMIIITTRDLQVLVAHGVKLIHNVNLLSDKEAILLFSRYAFGKEIPIQGYEELSRQVVCYAAGLPLTIKVLGSSLCGKSKLEWVDALARLKTIPLEETQKKLEISYIGLDDDYKEIFLDVATIMKGWQKETAIIALESRGFHARIGLRVLEQTSLITINDNFDERVGMHDHLEEMAKNIVRRSHPDMPNKHSRLWNYKEIENILVNDLGTEATKGIHFFPLRFNAKVFMNGLRKMKELWFLDVVDLHLNLENDKLVPNFLNALGFLCCLYPKHLKQIILSRFIWLTVVLYNFGKGEKESGPKLRSLDLGLTPNLETLRLERCGGLLELYMPEECLKLRSLELFDVKLRTLDLGLTPNLENLLLVSGDMVELHMPDRCLNLRSLNVDHSNLRTLDVGLTPNLEYLVLRSCYDLEELHMANECLKLRSLYLRGLKWRTLDLGPSPNLERLDLHKCTSLEEFHIYECPILTCIDISNLKLRTLDLKRVPNLSKLSLSECKVLVNLHLPHRCLNLRTIKFTNSWLRIFHLGQTPNLEELDLVKCDYLEEIQVVDECNKIVSLGLDHLKLWTLDLGLTPNLKKLHLKECYYLAQLHAPMGCLKNIVYFNLNGCLGFRSLFFNRRDDTSGRVHESLEDGPLAELHFTLERCPLHPDNNLPDFEFTCFHKEDIPSLTRGIEKLISEGQCACTKFETFSRSICGLQR